MKAIYPGAGETVETVVIPRLRVLRVRLANFVGVERAEVPEAVLEQPTFAVTATVRPGRR